MNIVGCGDLENGCSGSTSYKAGILLKDSQEYLVLAGTGSPMLMNQNNPTENCDEMFLIRYTQQLNPIYVVGINITYYAPFTQSVRWVKRKSFLQDSNSGYVRKSFHQNVEFNIPIYQVYRRLASWRPYPSAELGGDGVIFLKYHVREDNRHLNQSTFEFIRMFEIKFKIQYDQVQCAGSYIDVTTQKLSVALFNIDSPGAYAAVVLTGSISGGTNTFYFGGKQGVLIDIPEPYYFSMGDPITKNCTIVSSTKYTFFQNVSETLYSSSTLLQYTYAASPYYEKVPVTLPNIPQMADLTTFRKLTLPTGIQPLYTYTLGDIATVVQFGECVYNQSCSDFSITYSVIQQNGSAIPSGAMIFSSSARKLIISSLDIAMQGTYNLKFRCIIPDGFLAYQNLTVQILYDGRDLGQQNTTNTTTTNDTTTNSTSTNTTTSNTTTSNDTVATNMTTTNSTTTNDTSSNTTTTNTTSNTTTDNTTTSNSTTSTNNTSTTNDTSNNSTSNTNQTSINSTVTQNQSNSNTNTTSNQTVTVVTTKKYQPNYAPEFLENLINKWTVRAGAEATFTLPDFYDLNPTDKVSVSLETTEKHRNFFRIKNNKFIVFSAGFPELGDIDMIISLTDNHQPNPKTTKYRLTVSIMQSPFGQMSNDYVQQVNVSQSTKPQVFSFNSDQGVKVQAISPDGIIFWGFVNTQQIISHLPLLQINVPANLYYFFLLVVGSLKFDYLFSSTLIQDSFNIKDNYPSYDENFKNFGYDSSLAIQNMGFNTFILLMSPFLVVLTLTFIVFSKFIPKIEKFADFLQRLFVFSFPIRLFIESYLNIALSSLINLHFLSLEGSYGEGLSSIISLIFTTLLQVSYLLYALPFEDLMTNYIEIMNEGLVLINSQLLIVYTDANEDPYLRYDIGWAFSF
eukprot:403351437